MNPGSKKTTVVSFLQEECKKISRSEIETILSSRPLKPTKAVATTMFTSVAQAFLKEFPFQYTTLFLNVLHGLPPFRK